MNYIQRAKKWFTGGKLATLVLLLGQMSAALAAVIVNILAAKVLDPSDRGDLAFGLQISYFLTVFATMGLERPYIAVREGKFFQEYKNFTRLLLPGIIGIIPIAVLVVYLSPLGNSWISYGLLAVAMYTALNTVSRGVRVGYVVSRDWKRFGFNAIASQFLIIVGASILVALEISRPEVWMFVYLASTAPAVLLLGWAIRSGSSIPAFQREERRQLRRRGWLLLPADFSNTAMMRSDRLLLPILASSAELGLYVTVATVLEMASWPVKQWVDASLREWGKSGRALALSLRKIILKSLFFLILISILLGIAAFAMISLLLPETYKPATAAIVPLAIGGVIFGITRIQQGVLVAFGAAGSVSLVEIVGTIISIISYVFLIPLYGMVGAAYGSIIGYLACYIFGAIVLSKVKKRIEKE